MGGIADLINEHMGGGDDAPSTMPSTKIGQDALTTENKQQEAINKAADDKRSAAISEGLKIAGKTIAGSSEASSTMPQNSYTALFTPDKSAFQMGEHGGGNIGLQSTGASLTGPQIGSMAAPAPMSMAPATNPLSMPAPMPMPAPQAIQPMTAMPQIAPPMSPPPMAPILGAQQVSDRRAKAAIYSGNKELEAFLDRVYDKVSKRK